MREISIDEARYRIAATEHESRWIARAERADTGKQFGVECAGTSADQAADRVARWLEWQHEHAAALAELQRAEHAYHRTIAGSAFASPTEGPSPIEMQKDALVAVEAARIKLDDVRARRPETA